MSVVLPHLVSDVTQGQDAGPSRAAVSAHLLVISSPALREQPTLDAWRAPGVGVRLVGPVGPGFLDGELDEDLGTGTARKDKISINSLEGEM